MDVDTWKKLLGKTQDDPKVRSTLKSAGVKKTPKLEQERVDGVVDLKGHGMWLVMTDPAHFSDLTEHDIGVAQI